MASIPTQDDRRMVLNERIRLLSAFLNALSLGMIGFALIRPATESLDLVRLDAWTWALVGVAIHVLAHYVLRYLRKEKA